ncbi:MAG: amino acid adenylation domain-containing protein [bacterium]|nr:amino acid adenylation domain-containing protein [bacterium]
MRTSSTTTSSATFVEISRHRATAQPEQLAFSFLGAGNEATAQLTFEALDRQARAIAVELRRWCSVGDRALLLYPPGLDFIRAFFGCLYAGVVATPAYPPRANQKTSRLRAILSDAQAATVLTTQSIRSGASELEEGWGASALGWLATDTLGDERAEEWREPAIGADTLALLQYTSGSTGTPKGVMVSHENLIYNQRMLTAGFGTDEDSVVVSWLPLFHDMGLIGKMLHAHFVGVPCYLMSPMSFLKRPFVWLDAISRYRATLSGAPNFAYDLCVRRIPDEQAAGLDLSSWDVAFNASEPIRAATLQSFLQKFACRGFRKEAFYPCYGLAEATVMVSGGVKLAGQVFDRPDAPARGSDRTAEAAMEEREVERIGCGRTVLDQEIRIVDPETFEELPPGQVGEVWVSGPHIARGYWRKPTETRETFQAQLRGTDRDAHGSFLRTGDLGFLKGGELFITGRLKEILIIRGRNYYPQDLEKTVEACHPALRPHGGAAFSVEVDDEERAVFVQEVVRSHSQADFGEIFVAIRQAVTEEHDLNVHAIVLIKSGSLARTSSGKIQRRACRRAYLDKELRVLGEWHEFDLDRGSRMAARPARHELLTLVGEARHRRLLKYLRLRTVYALGGLTPHLDEGTLSSLGLDSLASIELVSSIEDELGVELPTSTLLDNATLPKICSEILQRLAAGEATPEMAEPDAECSDPTGVDLPLSHGQRSMWFLNKLAPESAAYNVTLTARIESTPDIPALERSLGILVHRHPALRTIFAEVDGEPVQRVLEPREFALGKTDAWGWSAETLRAAVAREIERPFDLTQGPVFRAHLFCVTSPTVARVDKVLVLTAHHIVIDLWSIAVLLDELRMIYAAECSGRSLALEPAPQYLEFVRWQQRTLSGPEGHRQWNYWSRQLAGELPTCELPTDHPRPAVQTFRGSSQGFRIDAATTRRIQALARSQGATPFHTLFAIFSILLARHSGHHDLVVGTAAAGRKRTRFRRLVGYCVNPVLLRADLHGNPSFCELLSQVRRTILDALDHQGLPFPLLVERLQPQRDPSRSPLFQVMFLMQKPHQLPDAGAFVLGRGDKRVDLGGLVLSPYAAPQPAAQFDLTMNLVPVDDELFGSLQYNCDLFEEVTIRRMVRHFEQLLASLVADPEQRIAEVALVPRPESHRQLVEWNDTGWSDGGARRGHGPLIHELFEAQAAAHPEATAVEYAGEELSYAELDSRANRLAHYLRARGVGAESLVGICVERSPEMVVGLMGILKAGAGYLPLDPSYPAERLAFMMEDAGIAVLLSEEGSSPRLLPSGVEVVCLPVSCDGPEELEAPATRVTAENLAYVLYTSGSTGRPKAVAIEHRSVVALLDWARREFSREELGGVLAATSICFDLSVFELYAPLCSGGKVILARNALELPQLPAAGEVTLVNTVPSAIAELLDRGGLPASVGTVNLAGEPLKRELVDRVYAQKTVRAVRNLYGPSEDTTYSTGALISRDRDHRSPSIGRPLLGTRAYLLDAQRRPVPTGVPGELYLGGAGLARGYLNRPQLTAERFIPDPLAPPAGGQAGRRLYRTGDLARFLPDGNLEFLGRIDHQVKIRGFRIEPAEIEDALAGHQAVTDVAIVAREDGPAPGTPRELRLVAYVVARVEVSVSELRAFLRDKMPEYMVPGVFVFMEALPRTLNGKLNRRVLPVPDRSRPELDSPLIAPRSELERTIAGVWRDVLGLEEVGITDNFFDLGGHSLLLAKVRGELQQRFEWELPIVDLFKHSTIRSLARHLSGSQLLRDRPPIEPQPAHRAPEDNRKPAATRITRRHSLKRQRQVRQQMRQQKQATKGFLVAR